MPRSALLLVGIALHACTYDYSRVPLVTPSDGGASDAALADAGSRFTCDPIEQTCTATLHCALVSDSGGELSARCVIAGSGAASAGCDGPEDCAPGYFCASTGGGSASCQSFCTDVAPTCADGRSCDTGTVLFATGAHRGHPCR